METQVAAKFYTPVVGNYTTLIGRVLSFLRSYLSNVGFVNDPSVSLAARVLFLHEEIIIIKKNQCSLNLLSDVKKEDS